jgi:hypothetical protein
MRQRSAAELIPHGRAHRPQAAQFRCIVLAHAVDHPGREQRGIGCAHGFPIEQRPSGFQRFDRSVITDLRRALQPLARRFRRCGAIAREFSGQHVGSCALPVFGGALQQRATVRRIGHEPDAVQVHEPEQVLGVGIAGVAGGVQQRNRLVELQRTQRSARRLEGILGRRALGLSRGRA